MPRMAMLVTVTTLTLAALPVGVGSAVAQAPSASAADPNFGLDWTARPGRRGNVVVAGYIVNHTPQRVIEVRLAVDTLDQAGQTIATKVYPLSDEVPPNDRAYFEVPVPGPPAQYRVRVVYWGWRGNP